MRILITGSTGLVGSNVIKVAREKYQAEIIASLFSSRPEVPWDSPSISMDLEDVASVRQAVKDSKSDVVIHCAAPRDEDRLEIDHAWGWAVMVTSTQALAEACREVDAKLIFVSSDWIFGNGGEPPYSEESPPCPVNYFGLLKVVGETLVSAICEDYAIVRIAGVYGPNWSYPSYEQTEAGVGFGWLANYFIYRLSRGQPVVVWTDYVNVLANPSLASDIADALLTIAAQDQRGIYHCCGRDSVNRLELAQAVAEVFGYDGRLVRPASTEEMDVLSLHGKVTAPRDSRLQVAYSEARLDRINLGLREGLEAYRRQLEQISKP